MGIFKNKSEKELDLLIEAVKMNMSNNYKDEAHKDFDKLVRCFETLSDKLSEKAKGKYQNELDKLSNELKGYSHKDQKPYWTR